MALSQATVSSLITIERKDALLTEVLLEVSQKSGLKFKLPKDCTNLKINAFAKAVQPKVLLDCIGDTLGFVGELKKDTYTYSLGPEFNRKALPDYLRVETSAAVQLTRSKLLALAALTQKPFQSYEPTTEPERKDETPEQWARRKITQPAYYAAGYACRSGSTVPGMAYQFHSPGWLMSESTYPFIVAARQRQINDLI